MSNGNAPVLTGWQYVVLELIKQVFLFATLVVTSLGANWAYNAKKRGEENQGRLDVMEKKVKDIDKHTRTVIGMQPPPDEP